MSISNIEARLKILDLVVYQIGNGSALNPFMTNSSFTLFDDRILIDCGYNVFKKLLKKKSIVHSKPLAETIEHVFITHYHDDHIGSLGSFLYYREFIVRKPITVYALGETYEFIKKYIIDKGIYEYPDNRRDLEYVKLVKLQENSNYSLLINSDALKNEMEKLLSKEDIPDELKEFIEREYSTYSTYKVEKEIVVKALRTNHGTHENYCYRFDIPIVYKIKDISLETENFFEHYTAYDEILRVVITGDTKASKQIEQFAFEDLNPIQNGKFPLLVFHDFSNFTSLDNIHTTKLDFETIYSEKFKKHVIKYHNDNKEYKKYWKIEDFKDLFYPTHI